MSSLRLGHGHPATLSRIQQADIWAGKCDKISSGYIEDVDASNHSQIYRYAPMEEMDDDIEDGANESNRMTSSNEDDSESIGGVSV